jgi:glycosyltransferase involved in cell wall biosynthesis
MAIPWRPTRALKKLLQQYKPDIVHVHHPFLLGVSALHAAKECNIPCVFTYHTIYEDYAHYVPLPNLLVKPLIHKTVQRFCNQVDGIIAPSNPIKKYLCAEQISKPITVIPSPLRTIFLTKHEKEKALKNKDHFNLLVVTRFVPEKNIPFIFDVFKQLPDNFNLTLVGYGNQYNAMNNLAFNTLKLSPDRVHFIHKPPQNELLQAYHHADLFIFSSTTDTQGIVLAESMSQGVPVIAIDGPGQRDIIINGYNGFIVNDTPEAISTILRIAHDTTLYSTLSAGAYATAQHYRADILTQKLLTFYHSVCLDLKK